MSPDPVASAEVDLLRRQLARERRSRRAAEQIGEAATAELWHTVQRLERAEAELRERAEISDLSYALSRSLRSDLDPGLMLDRAVCALGQALAVDRVVVRLAEQHRVGDLMAQWAAPDVPELAPESLPDEKFGRLVADHADRDAALWIDDLATDDRIIDPERVRADLACRAYAGVPLLAGTVLVGWLAMHTHTEPRAWSARDRAISRALAHDLSGALLQAQAYQRQVDTVRNLQQVDEVKNDFVWRVSHELRTPLTSIRGYAELMADGSVGEPTQGQRRTLSVILRNCQRLLSLTETLLSLSKVDAHEFQPARDPVGVAGLMSRVGDSALALTADRRLDVRLTVDAPDDLELRGDETELERALVNLVSNAVKFTPDGGRVEVAVTATPTSVVFEVTDTGCGIDEADRRRIFERFFRTHQATSQEVPGAGLGLSLVDSIVRAHEGEVTVGPGPASGACFRVTLPLGTA